MEQTTVMRSLVTGGIFVLLRASGCMTSKCAVGEVYAPGSLDSPPLCLWLELDPAPANTSNDKCGAKGGTLVTVLNADVQNVIRNMLLPYKTMNEQFYIGVHDIEENGRYRTYSGHAQEYFSWDISVYIAPQETTACVMADIDEDSKWREVDCSFPKRAVCSKPLTQRGYSYLFRKISLNTTLVAPVLYQQTTRSLLQCGALCCQANGCLSFCHAASNGQCVLNMGTKSDYSSIPSEIYDYYELISSIWF